MTQDGSQVRVGNDLSGNISVISPATNTVTTTISGGSGTATLLAAPLGIAFTKAGWDARTAGRRAIAIRSPSAGQLCSQP